MLGGLQKSGNCDVQGVTFEQRPEMKQAMGQSGKNVDRVELRLVYLRSGWNGGSRREVVEGEGRSPALKATESTLDSILSREGSHWKVLNRVVMWSLKDHPHG